MKLNELMLNTPLGAILVVILLLIAIVMLIPAAIAAWGAYRDRPGAQPRIVEEPPYRPTPTPEPPKKEEPKHIVAPATPEKDKPAPCPCKEEEPCAKERAEISRLITALGGREQEVDELTGRLSNANKKLEELQRENAKPAKPQKVTASNILPLLDDLGNINFSAAKQLRAEANKPQPEFARIEKRLGVFADYCEQRGFEHPDPGTLLQLLQDALKQ